MSWAKVYLEMAGLLATPRRGWLQITPAGRALLADAPARIDIALLDRFEGFRAARMARRERPDASSAPAPADAGSAAMTPEEQLEQAAAVLRARTLVDIRRRLLACAPDFFETLVVDLLVKMGYGGNRADAGQAIGGSGDGGVDGVIHEDRLGLDSIYVQAKRWAGTVGRSDIQRFVGALHGQRARKGVFITTGTFSAEARAYVQQIDPRVVLMDGDELAGRMHDFDLGVVSRAQYVTKQVDSGYFGDDPAA